MANLKRYQKSLDFFLDYHHRKNRNTLGGISFVQVVRQENIAEKREEGLYQISASRFFA